MGVQAQYYLTCSECGKQFIAKDSERFGETPEEIRDAAEEEGWSCYIGTMGSEDYCPECLKKQE